VRGGARGGCGGGAGTSKCGKMIGFGFGGLGASKKKNSSDGR
jgi:hypothetical protein